MAELDAEVSTELPERTLMRRRRRWHSYGYGYGYGYRYGLGAHTGAFASFGSVANANSTRQVNFNPQIVVNNGFVGGGIGISSHNANFNNTNQSGVPINFGL
jgi:hypothetical protein